MACSAWARSSGDFILATEQSSGIAQVNSVGGHDRSSHPAKRCLGGAKRCGCPRSARAGGRAGPGGAPVPSPRQRRLTPPVETPSQPALPSVDARGWMLRPRAGRWGQPCRWALPVSPIAAGRPRRRTDLGWTYTLAGATEHRERAGRLHRRAARRPRRPREPGSGRSRRFVGGVTAGHRVHGPERILHRCECLAGAAPAGWPASPVPWCSWPVDCWPHGSGARYPRHGGLLLGIDLRWHRLWDSGQCLAGAAGRFAGQAHGWQWSSWALALICVAGTAVMLWPARVMSAWALPQAQAAARGRAAVSLGRLPLRFGGLHAVRGGLHRLHDLCGGAAALAGSHPPPLSRCSMPCWAWR